MTVTTTWTDPSTGGAIDLSTGSPITETVWDKVLSNLKNISGVGGHAGNTYPAEGRLSLSNSGPISIANLADQTTLYYVPYKGDSITLFDGTSWALYKFTELSLDVSGFTPSKVFDIFIYNNAGTLELEPLVWTDASTRATALTTQDGVWVRSAASTKRYLGTIYIDAARKCQETAQKRYVWNYYNRVFRNFYTAELTNHTYNGAARKWNNSDTGNLLEFVIGINEEVMYCIISAMMNAGADGSQSIVYSFIDGVVNTGSTMRNYNNQSIWGTEIRQVSIPPIGYHIHQIYEQSNHASTTFSSCNQSLIIQM